MSYLPRFIQATTAPFCGSPALSQTTLYGGSFANDTVDYEANSPAYTFTPGFAPTLVAGSLTVNLPGIEYLNLYGPIGSGTVTVKGTPSDDAYQVALSGPNDASLSASFNQPILFGLKAYNFASYNVNGGGGGVNSVAITGTTGDDSATYDGTTATVNGVSVNVASDIQSLSVDLLAGNNQMTLNGSAGADAFSVSPTSNQYDSNITAAIAGATGPRSIALKSTQDVRIVNGGGADVLNVNGTLANNTFAQTDTTVRVDSGP